MRAGSLERMYYLFSVSLESSPEWRLIEEVVGVDLNLVKHLVDTRIETVLIRLESARGLGSEVLCLARHGTVEVRPVVKIAGLLN